MQELEFHYFSGLKTFRAFRNGEFNCVSFIERFVTGSLYSRMVHENIISGLAADKSETLVGVKPLNCALFFHFSSLRYVANPAKAGGSLSYVALTRDPDGRHQTLQRMSSALMKLEANN
jgi:hypothetical protein